jgi:dipeptidyl aminopeptidase/acylaminoacyl peptidase
LSLDGSGERQLTYDQLENAHPTFHPDGRSIIFSSLRSGRPNLWEIPIDGGPATRLTFGDGPDRGPDVSPDGKRLLFNVDTTVFHLFAYPLEGQPRRLTSKREDLSFVEAFPDGRELVGVALRQGRSYVVAIPASGGDVRTLTEGGTASIDPSGQLVLFTDAQDRRRMLIVPRTGGATRVVTEMRGKIFRIRSGADGYAHLMVQGDAGPEAWRVGIADGSTEREAPAPWAMVLPAPTGPWRMALRVSGNLLDDYACLLAPGMTPDDPGADIILGMDLNWDYDGRSVVYKHEGKVHRRFVDTRKDVTLNLELPLAVVNGLAVAPDGKTIYNVMFVGRVRREMITNYGDLPRPR